MSQRIKEIEDLIEELPEQYQQIFNYSKYDLSSSRNCDSRLNKISEIL